MDAIDRLILDPYYTISGPGRSEIIHFLDVEWNYSLPKMILTRIIDLKHRDQGMYDCLAKFTAKHYEQTMLMLGSDVADVSDTFWDDVCRYM